MRRAKPHELMDPAVPVITARLSKAELAKWLPIPFETIDDPLQAPEPSLGALAQLDAGGYVVLTYGKESEQLIVEFPIHTRDRTAQLAQFFDEVPLPLSRVLWHQKGARLPQHQTTARAAVPKAEKRKSVIQRVKRSALRAQAPAKRK
ncbi:MAG TPA: hypothetical protein VI670_14515 [Thermoanaerobaculia bacterium]